MAYRIFNHHCFGGRLALLWLAMWLPMESGAATPATHKLWVTDGTVYSVAQHDSQLYIGGDFTHVGPNNGQGVIIESATASVDNEFPRFRGGSVYAAVSDGNGGWYVGGDFLSINDNAEIFRLAHILADKTIDTAFKPNPNAPVYALAFDATHDALYVGGEFTTIKSTARANLAALNPDTAEVSTRFAPEPDGLVRALAVVNKGASVIVGGDFTHIAGSARNYLTALSYETGAPIAAWATTTADARVRAILRAVDTNTTDDEESTNVFVGGDFNAVAGITCGGVCEITISTGAVTPTFTPRINGPVHALSSSFTHLYVGGDFTQSDVTAINRLARFSLNTSGYALDSAWLPDPDDIVRALSMSATNFRDDRIYVGGDFGNIGNSAVAQGRDDKRRLAAINTTDAGSILTSFPTDGDGDVYTLTISTDASRLMVGGAFQTLNFVERNRLASLAAATGSADTWHPDVGDGAVHSLAVTADGSAVYVGGSFTTIKGTARGRLARIRADDATLFDWNPNLESGTVYDLTLARNGAQVQRLFPHPTDNQIIFAGTTQGLFKSSNSGATWQAVTSGLNAPEIRALVFDPLNANTAYLGTWGAGVFKSADGGTSWSAMNEGLDSLEIFDIGITADPHVLYIGTRTIQSKNAGFLKRNATNGSTWELLQNAEAHVIRVDPLTARLLYLGSTTGVVVYDPAQGETGFIEVSQGLKDKDITDIFITTTTLDNGDPVVFASAGAVLYKTVREPLTDSTGNVIRDDKGNTTPTTAWQIIRGNPGAPTATPPVPPTLLPSSPITKIALDPGSPSTILVSTSSKGVYRTTDTGQNWYSVNIGMGIPSAHALLKLPGSSGIYLAGTTLGFIFKTTNAHSADSTTVSWTESHDGLPVDNLYIAGDFTGATHPDYLASVTTSSGAPSYFNGWDALSSGPVISLALNAAGTTLYAGGNFTSIGGAARFRIAALDTTTALALSWSPSVDDGEVRSIALSHDEATLYLGGTFQTVANETRNRIAALRTNDGALTDWNPDSNNTVNVVRVINNDNLVLAGGEFTNIGGAMRRYLAMLKTQSDTLNATTWQPDPDDTITGQQAFFIREEAELFELFVGGRFANIGGTGSRSLTSFEFKFPVTTITPYPQAYNSEQIITLACIEKDIPPCEKIFYATTTNPSTADFELYVATAKPTLATNTTLTVYGETAESIRSANSPHNYIFDADMPQVTVNIPGGNYSYTQVVHFTCTDSGAAGCHATFYTLDGSLPTWREVSNNATGAHSYEPTGNTRVYTHVRAADAKSDYVPIRTDTELRYFSVDVAGNPSNEGAQLYKIERVPETGAVGWLELGLFTLAWFARGAWRTQRQRFILANSAASRGWYPPRQ